MMGLISCYSELSLQVSEKTSCSNYKTVTNSVTPNINTPSIQTAVTNTYKATSSTGDRHVITVTWCRNSTVQGLHITSGDDPTTGFKLNTSTRLFRKKRGNKTFEINDSKYEVYYDLSTAVYGAGAEPIEGYYVLIMVNSELVLILGDMSEEAAVKKFKINNNINNNNNSININNNNNINSDLVCRREHFSGNTIFAAKFSGAGSWHDVVIRCTGEDEGVKNPSLSVCIDKRVVVRVKRIRWNFRGNQTIFVDGLQVDLMWDVHDWFFESGSGSESGYGSGHGVFLFRTRSGLDSRLWLDDEVKRKDEKEGFSLLVYATKS